MPFCSKCGNEIAENIKFCPKCGNALQDEQRPNPSSSQGLNLNPKLLASQIKERIHTVSMSGFILICLCFLLPFISVQCGNNKVLELKGYHMVSGYEIKNTLSNQAMDKVDPNPFAIIMLISALAGIVLSYILKNKSGRLKIFVMRSLPAIILSALFWIYVMIESELAKKTDASIVTANYEIGYWLCVILSLALIVFAYCMIKSTKKETIISSVLAIILFLFGGVAGPKAAHKGPSPEMKASEVGPAAGTWRKLQEAYIIEFDRVGDCSEIGYTPPDNGQTKHFTYKCGVQGGVAIWMAENRVNLGECKAGNQWSVAMNKNSKVEVILPEDKNCQMLTPNFGR